MVGTASGSAGATVVCNGVAVAVDVTSAISADLGFSSRSPPANFRKSIESRSVLAVSRISRSGSSVALRNSCWNPLDIFFNGRSADPDTKVTIQELVRRGDSLVRVGKKLYRITVKEVEISK